MNVDGEFNGDGLLIGVDLTESKLNIWLPPIDWTLEFSDVKGSVGFGLQCTYFGSEAQALVKVEVNVSWVSGQLKLFILEEIPVALFCMSSIWFSAQVLGMGVDVVHVESFWMVD